MFMKKTLLLSFTTTATVLAALFILAGCDAGNDRALVDFKEQNIDRAHEAEDMLREQAEAQRKAIEEQTR